MASPRKAATAREAGLGLTVHAVGGQVYVWTVDRARRIAALEALGVDGVITNDPRLFDAY